MENELKTIKNWGLLYIVLTAIGGIVEIFIGLSFTFFLFAMGLGTIFVDSIYAFILYIIIAKIKSQNIIIEQNKEIIKLLSK